MSNINAIGRARDTKKTIETGGSILFPYNWRGFNSCVSGMLLEPTIISGISSSAKSSLTKWLYLQKAIEYAIEHKIKYKCLFFALEDTYDIIENMMLCYLYFKKYKEIIDIKLLTGMRFNKEGAVQLVSKDQLSKMESLSEELDLYMSYVIVEDSVYNSFGIWKACRQYASDNGKFYFKGKELNNADVTGGKTQWDSYKQNEKEFVAVIIDNMNLLEPEENQKDLYTAMTDMSSKYGKKLIIKGLKYHFCMVAQQSEEQSDLLHKKAGDILASERAIADCKRISKDSRVMLGVNYPHKLKQSTMFGYNLELMRGFYRCINICKNTFGSTGDVFSCLFVPHVNMWYLLPRIKKGESVPEETQEFIETILMKIKEYEEI